MGIQTFPTCLGIMIMLGLACCLICPVYPRTQFDDRPIVTTCSGRVRGDIERSEEGGQGLYFRFTGIPYGKFEKRFETSKPVDKWRGIRNATDPGPICYQETLSSGVVGVEDCLNLNVYTATLPSRRTSKRPVMVFIHGGAFFFGSGIMYKPNLLMTERDIVVVTVNYRLGAFGFLDLGIREAAGNQGGKDVVLALKWVQANIARFNGDPKQVTIFGESAGGVMVSHLIYSPMSQGLFHRAIAQSGVGVYSGAYNPRPKHYALRIATKVNCTSELNSNPDNETLKEIITCLQRQDKADILRTLNPTEEDWNNEADCAEIQFTFSVDQEIEGEERFLPESPLQLIRKGNFQKIPVMEGINEREALYFAIRTLYDEEKVTQLNNEWNRVAPMLFGYYSYGLGINNVSRDELSQKIREFYFQNNTIRNDGRRPSFTILEQALGDKIFMYPARRFAELLAEQGLPVYLYSFDKRMSRNPIGPVHAEELNYLFNIPPPDGVDPPIVSSSTEYDFAKHFVKLWISFATNGTPSHVWGNGSTTWERIDSNSSNMQWYHINDNLLQGQEESGSIRSRMEFWKNAAVEENIVNRIS